MDIKFMEKISFLNELRQQKIYWHSEFFGATKEKEYKIKHVCKPIKDKYFRKLYELFALAKTNIPYQEVGLDELVEIPLDVIKGNQKQLLTLVPKYTPKRGKILNTEIEYVAVKKTKAGWIIYLTVVGLWNI